MLRVVVCVSGGGTNLQAIIDGIANGSVFHTEIVRVVCNNPGARALERAKAAGIESVCVSPKDFEDRGAFGEALCRSVEEASPDLIVLAGFMVKVPTELIKKYENRIINVHPALIPAFCGTGYYGLRVHEAALARGVKITGATVHFVDEGMDTGPIIMQKAVEVHEDDTSETLQKRVMQEAEWVILPWCINLIAAGQVKVENGKVTVTE
ncbi:MAG: phosphoribosylglycinamide formyltransferase [Lachnospiraceae bacterium]|nr:phosphoribosylglycinamide formyltransferase [Lachnospiraceae bacterium]